jgi:hypothetical protein
MALFVGHAGCASVETLRKVLYSDILQKEHDSTLPQKTAK